MKITDENNNISPDDHEKLNIGRKINFSPSREKFLTLLSNKRDRLCLPDAQTVEEPAKSINQIATGVEPQIWRDRLTTGWQTHKSPLKHGSKLVH
jgi:hypothetical protein